MFDLKGFSREILRNGVFVALAWSVAVAWSLNWNLRQAHQQVITLATNEAISVFNKDQAFRRWSTSHGGVYVRPDERTPPNPYLAHLPDRDLLTTDGTQLTLMNPAYMMSQMVQFYEDLYGVKGKITGLVLLNPKNKPDPWEERALHRLIDDGDDEVVELADLEEQPFLRLMRPMVMVEGCVKCHGHLGFKVGDVRGGVSVSVPLAPYLATGAEAREAMLRLHLVSWLVGILVVVFASVWVHYRQREQAHAQEALRQSEERYELAAQGSNDGLFDWDLRSGRVYLSDRWFEMIGLPDKDRQVSPEDWFAMVREEDRGLLRAAIDAHVQGRSRALNCEYRLSDSAEEQWVHCRGVGVRDERGEVLRIAGSLTDVTARKQAEQLLEHQALHDPLTGLPNRLLFQAETQQAMEQFQRDSSHQFAVLFLDLDRFKNVNDSLGHAIGDRLLNHVAEALKEMVRPGDTVARLGGDEFAVLLDDIEGLDTAVHVAERMLEIIGLPVALEEHELTMGASIGITLGQEGYDAPEDMLRDADTAMYGAKAAGRGCLQVFSPEMHADALELLKMESDLRRALEAHQLEVHYQPIVHLASRRIIGMEALLRWRHPEHGMVSPGQFIPLAEDTGEIVPIGRWVLEQACRQLKTWHEHVEGSAELFVTVNLSSKQLLHDDVVSMVSRVLAESGLAGRFLHMELTESLLIQDPAATARSMARLRELGVQFSIDDFGTGYSSLAYLHGFAFDTLKVDRSFVMALDKVDQQHELISAMVGMAASLDMQVVAEGVETLAQAERLQALGCELVQGYYFYRPGHPDELVKHLLKNARGVRIQSVT